MISRVSDWDDAHANVWLWLQRRDSAPNGVVLIEPVAGETRCLFSLRNIRRAAFMWSVIVRICPFLAMADDAFGLSLWPLHMQEVLFNDRL